MNWKLKAFIQKAIAALPSRLSYELYYQVQRLAGGLGDIDAPFKLGGGVRLWDRLLAQGCDPVGKVFFEAGTGRVALMPIAYWLMGAKKTITMDLNPYLKMELVRHCLGRLMAERARVEELFGDRLYADRFAELLNMAAKPALSRAELLETCAMEYIAPGDAAATGLAAGCLDVHTSYNVLEHIPAEVIEAILAEGKRLLKDDGLSIHRIDYSDHFSHSDPAISPLNFLLYSQPKWDRYAGNRYMYMNRLRHPEYVALFGRAGLEVVSDDPFLDEEALALIESGSLKPDPSFRDFSAEELALTSSWIIARPKR